MTQSRTLTREGALIPFALFPLVAITGRGPNSGCGAGSAAVFWWFAGRHLPGAR